MAGYVVTGPLAVVKDPAGKVRYFYTGAAIPGDISADQLKLLTERGLISKVADPAPGFAELKEALSKDESSETGAANGSGSVERPAQVAAKPLWVEYAVSRGMSREEAESETMTKQKLIDAFPPE